ncbi:MAG: carboxylating nicotinate-nucleotide diphosphorylase [Planctomycetales bacterium]
MTLVFGDSEQQAARQLYVLALREDLGGAGDITSQAFLDPNAMGTVQIVVRNAGTIAGLPIVAAVFQRLDPQVQVKLLAEDGTHVTPGQVVGELHGKVLSLLAGERTALNFLTHLSGVATLTARFVAEVAGTKARILDTRKTLPGWRLLEKYAVRAGGGLNHRIGLFDAVLIKDNHLAAWKAENPTGSVADAVRRAREKAPHGTIVEVEVDSLEQLKDALQGAPDIVLLDNMPPDVMRQAAQIRDEMAPQVQLEASGGVNLSTVKAIAQTGVERISVGALTHSAPVLDLAFDWKTP